MNKIKNDDWLGYGARIGQTIYAHTALIWRPEAKILYPSFLWYANEHSFCVCAMFYHARIQRNRIVSKISPNFDPYKWKETVVIA